MFLPSSTNRTAIFNALKDTTRIFHNRLKLIDGNTIYYLSDLKSCTVTQNATGDERLSMGSAVSAELTATFIARYEGNITNIDDLVNRTTTPIDNYATYNYKGKKIVAQCGILYDEENFNYIDVGTFFIDEVSTNDDGVTVTIKAYDLLSSEYANQKVNLNGYTSSEKTIETLLTYIVTTYFGSFLSTNTVYYQLQNTNSKSKVLTDPELAILNGGLTVREVIAAVAGLIGCNAKINTQNQLWIGWFRTYNTSSDSVPAPNGYGIEITREVQYQRGLKKLQQSVFYLARCTSSNNGTGSSGESISHTSAGATAATGITFANIIITDEDIKDIAGATGATINHQWMAANRSYQPCEVSWRGNPCVEAGDTIRAIDTNNNYNIVYIAKQTLNLCGGFKSEITCPIGDAQITFGGGDYVTPQQLNVQVSLLEDELIRATNKINGAQGGYIKILDLDGDGNADTIFVTDKEITEADIDHTTGAINTGLGDNQPTKVIRINDEGIAIVSGPNAGTDVSAYSVVITGEKVVATDIIAGSVSTDKLAVGSSQSAGTLTAYINSTKQTADAAYNTQVIPEFWSSGSSTTTTHFCIPGKNSTSTVSTVNSSFRIRQGSTILVHMTTSSQGGTSTGQKYLRVCYNQYGHGSGYTGGSYPCTDIYKTDGTLYGSLPATSFIATIDLPIYYNGKPLLRNSPDLWAANTDVAFTWEGSHWTMSYSIPTTQTEGQSILSTDNMKIAEYCSTNDTTFIDGGKIYTGSITATQIAANTITGNEIRADTITADKLKANSITTRELSVGWQSGNLAASQWGNPSYSDDEYLQITVDDNGNQKLTVLQSFTSSQKSIYSAPFFIAEGAIIEMSATSFNISGASGSEISIWLQKSSSINGTYTTISRAEGYAGDAFIGRSSSTTVLSASYAVNGDSYYRLKVIGTYLNTNANAMNIYVTYKVTGNMIVTGRISSGDGNTYFDLDSSEIATRSGNFQSVLNSGGLLQYRKSSGYYYEMGYVQPVVFNSSYYTAIAYKPSYSSGLTIGYDDGNYNRIVEIKQGTASSGGIMTVASDRFCSVVNRRDTSWGTFYSKCGVGDVTDGIGVSRDSVSIALENSSNVTVARLNVIPDWGAAGGIAICGRGKLENYSASDSAFLEMGTSSLYWNGALISSGSSESLKKNITEYTGNATDLITSAKIYSFLYNEEDDKDPARYGVVIERECPTEIVEKTNKAISVYSMTSIAWKAIQELNNKIEKLEAIVNDGKSAKETS